MSDKYQNYINGEWLDAKNGETFDNTNPANLDETLGSFARSGVDDIHLAVAAAKTAFPSWRATPPIERATILKKALALMTEVATAY